MVTLSVYAALGNVLSPTKVFTALALFNQLRFPLIFFPMLLNSLAEGKLSLKRLTEFLLSEEIENYVETPVKGSDSSTSTSSRSTSSSGSSGDMSHNFSVVEEPYVNLIDAHTHTSSISASASNMKDVAIAIRNSTFSWTPRSSSAGTTTATTTSSSSSANAKRGNLKNIDLVIRKGEFLAVVGPVGSGKSSLISALLGDMYLLQSPSATADMITESATASTNTAAATALGATAETSVTSKESTASTHQPKVMIDGSVSYVPQTAWIPNDTLRNVILFGNEYDESKYNRVLKVCNLDRDLRLFESGDLTEIGEKGA